MTLRFGLMMISLAAGAGCDGQSKVDRVSLDALLTNGSVTEILEESPRVTNQLNQSELRRVLVSLTATNRSSASGSKAQWLSRLRFMSGTNEIGRLDHYDDDSWEFGAYVFRLHVQL